MQKTLPIPYYRDPAVYAQERTRIFACTWQILGLEADLAGPGDFISGVIAGFPLVAVRDGDGTLRAFHNVCRHRAGPLVDAPRGHCGQGLECAYHGWRYALDGRLRAATGFGAGEGFDPRDFSLFPVRVETWRGLVFVNADLDAEPLADQIAPLDALLGDGVFPTEPYRESHPIACNWKVYVENYLEGYHIERVHPTLAGEVEAGAYRVRMDGRVAIHEVPTKRGVTSGVWAWLWPNLAFNVYRDGVMIEHMVPEGHDRVRLDYLYLHAPGDAGVDAAVASSTRLTVEDRWVCERVQTNLDAGVYTTGVLSPRHEQAVGWFQSEVIRALADPAA
jgi:choline monooxygenase